MTPILPVYKDYIPDEKLEKQLIPEKDPKKIPIHKINGGKFKVISFQPLLINKITYRFILKVTEELNVETYSFTIKDKDDKTIYSNIPEFEIEKKVKEIYEALLGMNK